MFKKIVCSSLALLLCVFMSFPVYAVDITSIVSSQLVGDYNVMLGKLVFGGTEQYVNETSFQWKCPDCGYTDSGNGTTSVITCPGCGVKLYDPHKDVAIAGEPLHKHWLVVASVPVSSPSGVGRKPQGYTSPGVPAVSANGSLHISVEPYCIYPSDFDTCYFTNDEPSQSSAVLGNYYSTTSARHYYVVTASKIVAPYSGVYYVGNSFVGTANCFRGSGWVSTDFNYVPDSLYSLYASLSKGQEKYLCLSFAPGILSTFSYDANVIDVLVDPLVNPVTTVNNITTVNNTTIQGDTIYKDTTNNTYYSYTDNTCTVYYVDDSNKATSSVTYNEGDENYYVTVYQPVSVTPTTPPGTTDPTPTPAPGTTDPTPTPDPDAVYNVNVVSVGAWFADFAANIKAYFDGLAAGIAAGFAKLSADFTLAIDKLSINIENTFNKYMGTPETAQPTPTPIPSAEPTPTPAPTADPLPDPTATPTPIPDAPIIIEQQPSGVSVKSGTSVKYSIEARSTIESTLSYFWEWSADDGETWRAVTQRSPTISTATNMTMNGRLFRCTVSDAAGNSLQSNSVLLHVWDIESDLEPIVIDEQPADKTVPANSPVTFSCVAHSTLGSVLSYQWEMSTDGGETWNKHNYPSAFEVTALSALDGLLLRCTVSDGTDSVVSRVATLRVTSVSPSPTSSPSPTTPPSPGGGGGDDGDDGGGGDVIEIPPSDPGTLKEIYHKIFGDDADEHNWKYLLLAFISLIVTFFTFSVASSEVAQYLFPFIPPQVLFLLNCGLMILFIIAIFKFVLKLVK